jgi:hypothetical protein
MPKHKRFLAAAVGTLAACALIAIASTAAGAASAGKHDSGVLYTAVTHTSPNGKILYLAGNDVDKVLGSGAATYTSTLGAGTNGTLKVKATVILFTRKGSMVGTATATLTVNPKDSSVTITNGKIKAGKGQGAEAGHTLVATFTGSAKSIAGPFVFKYKGTYK